MPRETVIEELKDGVLLVTLNRPRQLNAFNRAMWRDAGDALGDARSADEVRAVVVTGAEGAFTAGQDLREMGRSSEAQGVEGQDNGFGSFMDRLCAFDKPLIAAVNGVGVGIGLTLLLHCDYVYIARGARLRAPFVTLGALRHTKRLLLATREAQVRAARLREDQAFRVRVGSPENVEAIRAFIEKREPDFSSVPPHDRSS